MEGKPDLRPTPEQYREFSSFLCNAHSWYKHLPLIEGVEFVVFVAPDSGTGRVVFKPTRKKSRFDFGRLGRFKVKTPIEGPEFTEEHPRPHYSWTTTKEYRRRFGYLDFMARRKPEDPWGRDYGPRIDLPTELVKKCSFILYPYVSPGFAVDVLPAALRAEVIEKLRAGAEHPAREKILELVSQLGILQDSVKKVDKSERTRMIWQSPAVHYYLYFARRSVITENFQETMERIKELSAELLAMEVGKIDRALAALDDWLTREK